MNEPTVKRRGGRARIGAALAAGVVALAWSAPAASPAPAPEPRETAVPRATVAAVDFAPRAGELETNRRQLERRVRLASERGARYVVLPELGVSGPPPEGATPEDLRAVAEPVPGPTTDHFARLARELDVWLALSVLEAGAAPESYFVTAVLLDERGAIAARHRKIMVQPDSAGGHLTRGDFRAILEAVDDRGLRVGVLSGDDIQVGIPRLADRGADLILICAAWPAAAATDWRGTSRTLAERYATDLAIANLQPPEGGAGVRGGVIGSSGRIFVPDSRGIAVAALERPVESWRLASALGLPESVPVPSHQPASARIRELGERLFFDAGMSSTGEVSCATCHQPELAFTNGLEKGIGVHDRRTKRNVPTLLNVAFKPLLRWDGYASMLEKFAKYPLSGRNEMDFHYLDEVVDYVGARPEYADGLVESLGLESPDNLEFEHVARALATYLRSLVSGNSAFDRYYYSGDESALSDSARRGLELFTGKADCERCHVIGSRYALFMDLDYHFLGVGYEPNPGASADIGLGSISTNDFAGWFQTPSLRDVARTAPYMHDGSIETLEEVIDFFDRGGIVVEGRPAELKRLALSPAEKLDLVEFLRSLDGDWSYDRPARAGDAVARGGR